MMKSETIDRIRKFTEERDWDKFHSPSNLAKSIVIEAAELLECFQWSDEEYDLQHIREELADVIVYSQNFLDKLELDVDEIVNTIYLISGSFGGVNLEDISAPRCFEIERKLKEKCDIPIFHDDQHGTAIVVSAGMLNAMKVTNRDFTKARIVINGAGSAGISIAKLLLSIGIGDIILVDKQGALAVGEEWMNPAQAAMAKITNKENLHGSLAEVLKGRDAFIGVSAPNILTAEMVSTMAKDPIIFAMANPVPEIMPNEAKRGGAAVIATGRSDLPNQINNVLVFPGVFRGAFDVCASDINEEMKIAAAKALADMVTDDKLNAEYIIPYAFDRNVGKTVAKAVADAAIKTGVARIK